MAIGTFSTDFADWLDYTITHYPWTGYDKYGGPTYGSSATIYCYKQEIPTLIQDMSGHQAVSKAQFYKAGNSTVTQLSKIVQANGDYPPIMRVDQYYNDKSTLEMTVVYI